MAGRFCRVVALVVTGVLPISIAAQETFSGQWTARRATTREAGRDSALATPTVHVALRTPDLNTFYAALSRFDGLTDDQLGAADAPVRFTLTHDAGTFAFTGRVRDQRGAGEFRFTPDPRFADRLAEKGMTRPSAAQQFSLARHDLGLAFLDELIAQGYVIPTTGQLERAAVNGADLRGLREMGELGYRLGTLSAFMRLWNNGARPDFIREIQAAGYSGLSPDDLVQLNNHSIGGEFIARANERAGRRLSVSELVNQQVHGDKRNRSAKADSHEAHSTPLGGDWVITALKGDEIHLELLWSDDTQWRRVIGLSALQGWSARQIESSSSGSTAFSIRQDAGDFDFVGSAGRGRGTGRFVFRPKRGFRDTLSALGVDVPATVSDHQLKNLAWGGISTAAIREFKSLGFSQLTLRQLTDMAVRIVSPDYVRALRATGVTDASTVDDVVELRFGGITPEYLRELRELGHRNLSAQEVLELRDSTRRQTGRRKRSTP